MAIDPIEMDSGISAPELENNNTVQITGEDKQRIYYPWRFSLIIKLQEKKILHQVLKRKITDLWKPSEAFPLIDLGEGYYTVKFNKEENMAIALQKGPWFIFGAFLSVQRWEPNFVPSRAIQTLTAIWVRLPELPIEFYDDKILAKVGNKIGRLLKVDTCTSAALRGRYARICVELPLNKQVKSFVWIGSHKQQILYECEKLLCLNCGYLGHSSSKCLKTNTQIKAHFIKQKEDLKQKTQKHNIQEELGKVIQKDLLKPTVEDTSSED
ncbi:PREDICTED: uncharacterized protein LOC109232468 [Nicotiana attenuata]|uniref:uncharacterized protein LOC109232468 n=1 Tax=Nicotiana attenuata TaxID=49451 RepID=UPI0009046DBA|nr:PREDICTED: uncharacterized protein LOC109232468 [Nicotiana attenuata]